MAGNHKQIGQKVPKRGITVGKRAEIETITFMHNFISICVYNLISRKSFERSKRSSDKSVFLLKTLKGQNLALKPFQETL